MTKRVAGIMRVKNEGTFIHDCIESCISALDELIVVYNDCTDNSAAEIEKMAHKYPDKIRVYEYPYTVRAYGLTRKEFEELKECPEDDHRLFSAYSNFALSKVTADYALIIDADQFYFTSKLKEWCDFMRDCEPMQLTKKIRAGKLFQYYLSFYRLLSLKFGIVLPIMPSWLLRIAYPAYLEYAKYSFSHDVACMALSGVNVLETDETLISMGHSSDILMMLPPFNGSGDHLVFKMSDKVKFEKYFMPEYNNEDGSSFCIAEKLVTPYRRLTYIGFFWKHMRTMRQDIIDKALEAYSLDKKSFLDINSFREQSYRKILRHSPKNIFFPFNRILFGFVYKANKDDMFKSLETEKIGGAIKSIR